MTSEDLKRLMALRAEIDEVDQDLAEVLVRRAQLVETLSAEKTRLRLPAVDLGREAEVLSRFPEGLPRLMARGVVVASAEWQEARRCGNKS